MRLSTDAVAVLVIAVTSVFFAATAVKNDVIAAKADTAAVKTAATSVNTVMTLNFQTYCTTVFAAVASAFAVSAADFTAVALVLQM